MSVPRSASLRVAHQRACPNFTRSSLDSIGARAGCTCKPSYFTLHRDRTGRAIKGPRLTDKRVAERSLRQLQVEIDEGRVGLRREQSTDKTFREWAAEYVGFLGDKRRKATTVRAYDVTIKIANEAFGDVLLDEIGNPELRDFGRLIRGAKGEGSDATASKHLRHVSAILEAAVEDELIARNPVPKFRKSLGLRVGKGDEAYTDAELEALWAAMGKLKYKAVYVTICKAAVATGARRGELIAATWDDLDLSRGKLRIAHTYNPVDGLTTPKDNEARTVHLIPPAARLFEEWVAACGVRPGDEPMFQAPHGGRIAGDYLGRLIIKARDKAGIPIIGENGRPRKPFHAFRACFARICREAGLDPQWVQTQLGHSSADLTLNVYGKWSDVGLAAEAAKLTGEAFPA